MMSPHPIRLRAEAFACGCGLVCLFVFPTLAGLWLVGAIP